MDCGQLQSLLDAHIDGELDPAHSSEVEQHLADCPTCARAEQERHALQEALRAGGPYHRAPVQLRERIKRAIGPAAQRSAQRPVVPWRTVAIAASLALAVVGGWAFTRLRPGGPAGELVAQAIVGSHIRSLLATHLLDVVSTDQHTVKPWFRGQVDFAPAVVDLKAQGFTLEGGRLDYVEGRNVAAIVYKRRQHVINLFIRPTAAANQDPQDLERQGYHLVHWVKSGMEFWAISDLIEQELRQFAALIEQKTD